jgi:uncharacterized protein
MPMNNVEGMQNTAKPPTKSGGRRGFAGMDRTHVRELASKGGKAAHKKGTAHEFTPEEAREAGRKGGLATHGPRESSGSKEPGPSS